MRLVIKTITMKTRLCFGHRCPARKIFIFELHGGSWRTTFVLVTLSPVTNLTLTRTTRKHVCENE